MEKVLLHEHIIDFKGIKKKVIYHFSDSHLTQYDTLSDEAETEKAKKQTVAWEDVRKGFASTYGEPYGEAQRLSPKEHFENLLNVAEDGDALVIAGDTLDYINGANLRLSDSLLSQTKVKYIAVCGNHEPQKDIPEGHEISKAKQPVQTIDLGDMLIIGLENSQRRISREQLDFLNYALNLNKPLLIVMHVPIMNDENETLLRKSGEYFQLNYDNCPAENKEFIELLKSNDKKIVAILAGHLHYGNISHITPDLKQYVSSQGITGNINRYVIGE